jgi:hypothetical protein
LNQISAVGRHSSAEGDGGVADLLVALKGDVPAHHVVKEDPEAPDCSRRSVVSVEPNPFRRGVDSSTVKVPVGTVAHEGSGSEVDQFEIEGVEVDQEIFVLDVPVDHTLTVAGQNRLHHLAEKVASHRLLQHALLRDEIKQIFARFGSLHDNYKGVVALKAVQDLDHSGATVDFSEQADFQWNWSSINLTIF